MAPPTSGRPSPVPSDFDSQDATPTEAPADTQQPSRGLTRSVSPRSSSNPRPRPSFQGQSSFAPAGLSMGRMGTPDQPHRPPSPGQSDRVFPIRSVISVDATQTPFLGPGRLSGEHEGFPGFTVPDGVSSPRSSVSSDVGSPFGVPPRRNTGASSSSREPSAPGISRRSTYAHIRERRDRSSTSDPAGPAITQHSDAPHLQIRNDAGSEKSEISGQTSGGGGIPPPIPHIDQPSPTESEKQFMTTRFSHVITEDGHAVITGRDGELQQCEDEPIHIPGAVQGFGLLIALEETPEGCFLVRVVSENSLRIIGYTPQELFRLTSFTDILSDEQADNLLDHVDFIRDEDADPATNGPEVFTLSVRPPNQNRRNVKLWCAMHSSPAQPDLIICEFELDDDKECPLIPVDSESPEMPEDTLSSEPTDEELAESTLNTSRPLRVLRSARKRRGEAAAMEVFNILSQVQEQLSAAPNLETFLKILVGVVKDLTGFHRVMIYQFDSTFNGRVVTELVDPRATRDLYKGLNFPASDIPKQARELYKINKVRLLYDRDQPTARLVCRTMEDLERPLDLTYSYLRAMSPIHIKYLGNMGVRSSMSISINAFDELWGLVSCHSYGAKGMRVSFPIRKMCRLIGDTSSRNIERLSYASRLQARKLVNTVPTKANPAGYIIASSDDLLSLFDADYGLLSIRGETKILGKLDQSQEALVILEYLRIRRFTSVITSQDVHTDFPDLRYPPGFNVIAGLLLVPLSVGGHDFIVFFRRGQTKEVRWAGNPYEKTIREGTKAYLEPRKSFKMWMEKVVGKCREWTEEQIETAAVLCLVYGKFIEVWRQKEAALQSSQLTKLLLANSAHEVRTPLNAIINYLEIALEGTLDKETRDNLAKSHSASKSLIYVINDLLDLTKTAEGLTLVKDEAFDLQNMIEEATAPFINDAKRKGLEYQVSTHPGIPQRVLGDERHIRQAISNLTANAIKNTSEGSVRVDLWCVEISEQHIVIDIAVQDTGVGMPSKKVEAMFRELEQVSTESDELSDTASSTPSSPGGGRTLGLGLAVVARIIRIMGGQLRLKSEEGKGSRFVVQLPFELPSNEPEKLKDLKDTVTSTHSSITHAKTTVPPSAEGEVVLVNRAGSAREEIARRRSYEDARSWHSNSSGRSGKSGKSDVDRLIDAISEPLSVGQPEPDETALARSNSSGWRNPGSASNFTISRRSKSQTALNEAAKETQPPPGVEFIEGNKTVLKAVKMPDEFQEDSDPPDTGTTASTSRVLFEVTDKQADALERHSSTRSQETPLSPKVQINTFRVLLAEDDPINSRIMLKRLTKVGHEVHHTANGQECESAYHEKPEAFDVVLMDMQMPIVDGLTSTKLIREYEQTLQRSDLSQRSSANGRVPIFAVSASLVERDLETYVDTGFDGWILKPIDFKRLGVLMDGIVEADVRNANIYKPGQWETGGWFFSTSMASQILQSPVQETSDPDETPKAEEPSRDTTPSK